MPRKNAARTILALPLAAIVAALVAGMPARAAEPIVVENETLRAAFDPAAKTFSLACKANGRTFARGGVLPAVKEGAATAAAAAHKAFGAGRQIEVAGAGGARATIALYPGVPFALFTTTLHNGGAEAVEYDRVGCLSAALDLGRPLEELRTLGTGGLLPVAKNPGSYAWLAIADPASRAGVVGGWVTNDRGSGVVFSPVEAGAPRIEARIDYGRLRVRPGAAAVTETFALGWFDDARLGLEQYADAIAKVYAVALPPQPAGYCTWYAEKHGGACGEKPLAELAAFAAEKLAPFGFEFVQIDDGWQAGVSKNGPNRDFTRHRPGGPFPGGMKAAADRIAALGLKPGIWFMPFAGTSYDPLFEKRLDWFAKDKDGKPFETEWGGTCLDMTQPGPREHLRQLVGRMRREWGYRVFKMDGLWTGTATRLMYVNDGYKDDQIGEARLADPDKTHIEAFRDGLKLVRQAAGPDTFLLGCCVSQNMRSLGGSFGLVDAMRIGPDTGAGEIGAPHGSRNYFLHGRVWQNDPDCVSVRTSATLDRARLNATFTAISGQLFYNSDWLPDLPPERLDILRRTMPAHGLPARPVDLFEHEPARVWLLSDARRAPRRDVAAFYNWDAARPLAIEVPLARLGLPPGEHVGYDFWAQKFVPPVREKIALALPPASCRVLALRPAADHPQVISTSRHVTQGMIDVLEERWDAATKTLAGMSRVVGGDAYELRIVAPVGADSFQAAAVRVADEDAAAGVKAEVRQDGPKVWAKLLSPVSREVRWQVTFAPAAVAAPAPPAVADLKAAADFFSGAVLQWRDAGAEGYRITRGDGAVFHTPQPRLADGDVPRGKTHQYRVEALGWTGAASAPASVEVAVPGEPKRPPPPPKPAIALAELKPLAATVGWGKLGIDKSVEGKPLSVEGKTYARGVGVHAPSLLVYKVPAGAKRFVSVVGLDDEQRHDPRASVVFEVHADVKEMGEPPALLGRSPVLSSKTLRSWAFDLPLDARVKELRLVVTDADDGMACDHADWIDAGFISGDGG